MPAVPTKEQLLYMQAHAEDTLVVNIIVCCTICGIGSIFIILFRFVSRWLVRRRLVIEMSDWLLIVAWLFYADLVVCFALSIEYGAGRHIILVTNPRNLQIMNIVNENVYCFSMAFIKFSILRLYGGIFASRQFRYILWAMATFVAAWAVSIAIVADVQCMPIAYGWDPTIPGGYCLDYGLCVLIAGIFNVVTDLIILTMPIPLVWRLQISTQKKRLVAFTFALGGSACIISIIRLAYTLEVGTTPDGSWDMIPAGMLTVVELTTGMLAASIPTYRPLYRFIIHGPTAAGESQKRSGNDHTSHSTKISAGRSFRNINPNGIHVTDQIDLVNYTNKNGAWVAVPDEDESVLLAS